MALPFITQGFRMARRFSVVLRSVRALALAAVAVPLVNLTGGWGAGFVSLVLVLFAFSSIVVNYLYAENNLIFLKLDSRTAIGALRLAVILMIIAGSFLSMPLVWQLADIIMALMAITNLTAILLLSPVVTLIARDYLRQRKLGVPPVFDPAR